MSAILGKVTAAARAFAKRGYLPLYNQIFGSQQFPYWFALQCVWCCYVVRHSCQRQPRTALSALRQLLVSASMTFAARELFTFIYSRPSQIRQHPVSLAIFAGVFAAVTFSPSDIAYKALGFGAHFIASFQALNLMRFFTRMFRMVKSLGQKKLFVVLGLSVLDQILEIVLRGFVAGVETRLSNMQSLLITVTVLLAWFLGTQRNPLTKWIGIYDERFAALVLGTVLGFANGLLGAAAPGREAGPARRPADAPAREPAPTPGANAEEETAGTESNMIAFRGSPARLMDRISGHEDVVVLALWAKWHPACKKLHVRLPLIAVEHRNALFIEVELGESPDVADALDVETVPQVWFYRNGKFVEKIVGYDIWKVQEALLNLAKV